MPLIAQWAGGELARQSAVACLSSYVRIANRGYRPTLLAARRQVLLAEYKIGGSK